MKKASFWSVNFQRLKEWGLLDIVRASSYIVCYSKSLISLNSSIEHAICYSFHSFPEAKYNESFSEEDGALRCGSTIIMASFSDITSWQNWSPTLAKMYFEVSRSIPSAREEEGIHRFMASGSLCWGLRNPSTRSTPFRVKISLRQKGRQSNT